MRKNTKKTLRVNKGLETALQVRPKAEVGPAPEAAGKGGVKKVASGQLEVKPTRTLDEQLDNLCELTGTHHPEVAVRIATQLADSLNFPAGFTDAEFALRQAVSLLEEFEPKNATESMLAAQMIATQDAALMYLKRAALPGQTLEGSDSNVLRAMRLMRLHLEQIEAMQKLKGKSGQQKVVVEHVHVHVNEGGHAIVGAVNAAKAEGGGGQ